MTGWPQYQPLTRSETEECGQWVPNTALQSSVGLTGLLPLRKHLQEKGTGRGKPRANRKNDSLKFKKKKSRKGEEDKTSLNTIGNYSHEKGLQWALSIHPLARWAHVLESCGEKRPGRG